MNPSRRRKLRHASSLGGAPSMVIVPALGGVSPRRIRINVVFPDPL
jgi:hypothetical protein